MFVVFIHGPAASGKHTVGTMLARRTGLPLFHNHLAVDLATALFDFGTPSCARLRAEVWRSAFRECANASRSFIFTFTPDATVDPSHVDELVGMIEAADGAVLFVELVCSRPTIMARLQNDSRKRFGKLTEPAMYESIASAGGFEFPDLPEPVVRIDTDSFAPEESAIEIENAIARMAPGDV